MINIEPLLAETSDSGPCGIDLEYDSAFLEFDTLARGKAEQQFGDTVIAAEEPNWAQVQAQAETLLGRSKDLRIAVLYARAVTHTGGLAGFNAGIALIRELLTRYWAQIYPLLDAEENDDPLFRVNALMPLADGDMMLRDVRAAAIVRSRAAGVVTVRDVEIAQGRLPAREGEAQMTENQVQGILAAAQTEQENALQAGLDMLPGVKALASLLSERVGSDRAPDFSRLIAIAQAVGSACRQAGGDAPEPIEQAGGANAPAAHAAKPISGEITSRQDAIRMLDKVCEYIERAEPTNPAPLLIKRAKALMNKDFLEIMRDLAPDSLNQIHLIAGTSDNR